MTRRVWVIAKKDKVEQSDIDNALLNNCSEILKGIPPALLDILSEGQLPYAYEEPEAPKLEPLRDPLIEIDEIKAKIADYNDVKIQLARKLELNPLVDWQALWDGASSVDKIRILARMLGIVP
jgi:hypothetical protein